MSMLSEWIDVDTSRYEVEEIERLKSIVVHMNVSPYDVPQRISMQFDENKKRILLYFAYVQDEPKFEVNLDKHAQALMGRSSCRIYCISVEDGIKKHELLSLRNDLDNALDELTDRPKIRHTRPINYKTVRKILDDYWSALISMLDARPTAASRL